MRSGTLGFHNEEVGHPTPEGDSNRRVKTKKSEVITALQQFKSLWKGGADWIGLLRGSDRFNLLTARIVFRSFCSTVDLGIATRGGGDGDYLDWGSTRFFSGKSVHWSIAGDCHHFGTAVVGRFKGPTLVSEQKVALVPKRSVIFHKTPFQKDLRLHYVREYKWLFVLTPFGLNFSIQK